MIAPEEYSAKRVEHFLLAVQFPRSIQRSKFITRQSPRDNAEIKV